MVQVFRVNALSPATPELLLEGAAGKFKPLLVEEGAELVRVLHPDKNRRCVGERAKPSLAFSKRVLRLLAQCDVARHPAREGRFAMFV
jgi:hypothetical protein